MEGSLGQSLLYVNDKEREKQFRGILTKGVGASWGASLIEREGG